MLVTYGLTEQNGNGRHPEWPKLTSETESKGVTERLFKICDAICAPTVKNPRIVCVFVLHTEFEYEESFDYLWKFLNVHVYLAELPLILKTDDKEIQVSRERKKSRRSPFRVFSACGYLRCKSNSSYLIATNLEKRVLVLVLNVTLQETTFNNPISLRRSLSSGLTLKNYFHNYRSVIIELYLDNETSPSFSYIVRRSGLLSASNVMALSADDFEMSDAKKVFDPIELVCNRSQKLTLDFSSLYSTEKKNKPVDGILLRDCHDVSFV